MSKLKKIVDESKEKKTKQIDLSDRGISNINEVPGLSKQFGFLFLNLWEDKAGYLFVTNLMPHSLKHFFDTKDTFITVCYVQSQIYTSWSQKYKMQLFALQNNYTYFLFGNAI